MMTLQDLSLLDGRHLARLVAQPQEVLTELRKSELLGLIELLTFRLTVDNETFSSDDWAIASKAVDEVFATAEDAEIISRNESALRRLNLSAAILKNFYPCECISLLNPHHMHTIFMGTMPISLNDARSLAPDWRSRDISVIRQLRLVKNLVKPMLYVSRTMFDEATAAELNSWEEILPLLP
jgi:hypothetical protein